MATEFERELLEGPLVGLRDKGSFDFAQDDKWAEPEANARVLSANCQVLVFYCGREESFGGGSDAGAVVGNAVCDVVGMGSARGGSGTVVMALSGFNR
jgi:hypothetical protein